MTGAKDSLRRYTCRVRLVETPGRWKLFKALITGKYTTVWLDQKDLVVKDG